MRYVILGILALLCYACKVVCEKCLFYRMTNTVTRANWESSALAQYK